MATLGEDDEQLVDAIANSQEDAESEASAPDDSLQDAESEASAPDDSLLLREQEEAKRKAQEQSQMTMAKMKTVDRNLVELHYP